ncbi:TOPRIM nucleotidyl transferase/hydrolase domain-containing protein [Ruminococcus sp. 5_1_39BFAA]|uniref:TOPRIM nucleotidyl transferase/hydrolase domain-containing protein n=1 Tax=Ruminococcus sp. 5_1_39BFAA TaxID=457412 RepID=UPI0035650181
MEFKNYWGTSEDFQDDLKYTDNIHRIMEEQCKYLFQYTKGKIFAVFGEIKMDGSMFAVVSAMANAFKGVSGTVLQETVAEASTRDLIDANAMYFDKRYGFEICTEKYRFRLFELRMTPIYPVEIIVDEGICKNIGNTLSRIAIPMEKFNRFKISDEDTFCNVLQEILQDKKVRYIIGELQKRVQDKNEIKEYLPEKVIICEGQTDEIVLQAIAQKLSQKVTIVVANGKYNVPAIFDAVKGKNTKSNILIVVDSDGDEEETKKMINEKMGADNYELAIINNRIEDWFMPEVADFSKLKLMQSIDAIIEDIDMEELSKTDKSFAKVVDFLKK